MSLCSLRLKPWTFKPSSAHSQRNHCWQPHTSTSSIIQSTYLRFVTFRPVTCLWCSRARRVFRRAHPPVCSSSLPEPQQTGWTTDPSSPAHTHTNTNTTTLDNTLPQCFTSVAEVTLKARLGADSIINETLCSAAGQIKMSEALVFPLSTAPFFGSDDSDLLGSI